ncbi:MAG: hypothetical protein LZF61_10335 [Nitrosomonas sp.]|nr:MAG: hypothetical protein LZF61_10335 [Nitrosomonas sp.]
MKFSFLSGIVLVACLCAHSMQVMAIHHEPKKEQGSTEKMSDNEGVVVSTIDSGGYTYMELENSGRQFWIAAPSTQVKVGDHIRFFESMVMTNFTSKTLNRTFGTLIFVTSTQVKQ